MRTRKELDPGVVFEEVVEVKEFYAVCGKCDNQWSANEAKGSR